MANRKSERKLAPKLVQTAMPEKSRREKRKELPLQTVKQIQECILPAHGDQKYHPGLDQFAHNLSLNGCTNVEIARIIGIQEDVFYAWQRRYPSFEKHVELGRESADGEVVAALHAIAKGNWEIVKVHRTTNPDGSVTETTETTYTTPNVSAIRFWLTNRMSGKWKNAHKVEISGTTEHVQTHINVSDPDKAAEIYRNLISGSK